MVTRHHHHHKHHCPHTTRHCYPPLSSTTYSDTTLFCSLYCRRHHRTTTDPHTSFARDAHHPPHRLTASPIPYIHTDWTHLPQPQHTHHTHPRWQNQVSTCWWLELSNPESGPTITFSRSQRRCSLVWVPTLSVRTSAPWLCVGGAKKSILMPKSASFKNALYEDEDSGTLCTVVDGTDLTDVRRKNRFAVIIVNLGGCDCPLHLDHVTQAIERETRRLNPPEPLVKAQEAQEHRI